MAIKVIRRVYVHIVQLELTCWSCRLACWTIRVTETKVDLFPYLIYDWLLNTFRGSAVQKHFCISCCQPRGFWMSDVKATELFRRNVSFSLHWREHNNLYSKSANKLSTNALILTTCSKFAFMYKFVKV